MKAQNNTNKMTKIFSLIAILALSSNISFSQGLLAETAAKLFSGFSKETTHTEANVSFAGFTENENDSFNIHNIFNAIKETETYDNSKNSSNVVIIRSFQVSDLNISIENNIHTENWMIEPFAEDTESSISTEEWMTKPIYTSFEESIEVEEWMTTPMYKTALESEITVEDWMTTSFEITQEAPLTVENWMTQPFSDSQEELLVVEEWMTTAF